MRSTPIHTIFARLPPEWSCEDGVVVKASWACISDMVLLLAAPQVGDYGWMLQHGQQTWKQSTAASSITLHNHFCGW